MKTTHVEKRGEELIRIREIPGAEVLEYLSCAGISERFFQRTRAWMTQRLNNNIVNGRPVGFTGDELLVLRNGLKTIASEIVKFTDKIPKMESDMAVKVYVIRDRGAIEYMMNDDLEGFRAYLEEDPYMDFGDPEYFDTEAEALAFCAGVGHGMDERNPEMYVLRSSEDGDMRFIEAIENIG